MRQGNRPSVLFDRRGRVLAIGTGSDACAEHECGSDELMRFLTGHEPPKSIDVADQLIRGKLKAVPDVMAARRITCNLDSIVYGEQQLDGVACGTVVFSTRFTPEPFGNRFIDSELQFSTFSQDRKEFTGAWDASSFGFRVKGDKLVAQLREFTQALKAGKCIFAGLFLKKDGSHPISGVVIAREDLFRPEHRAAMRAAQDEFASKVSIAKLRADLGERRVGA